MRRLPSEPTSKSGLFRVSFWGGFPVGRSCGIPAAAVVGGCGISAARFVEPCGNPRWTLRRCCGIRRWNFAATVVGTSWKPAANVVGKIVGCCGIFCGNGRWRVVGQPLTLVRGQASLPFSWARHLPPRPGVRSGWRNIPASNGRSTWQPFRGTFDAPNCDQPGGVGSGGVRTAAVSFGEAARRTRCDRRPDAFSKGLVSYPISAF